MNFQVDQLTLYFPFTEADIDVDVFMDIPLGMGVY